MSARELFTEDLYSTCDVTPFPFETTGDIEALPLKLGQPRAVEAVPFGIDIQGDGYNIYTLGALGTGKRRLVLDFLKQRARDLYNPARIAPKIEALLEARLSGMAYLLRFEAFSQGGNTRPAPPRRNLLGDRSWEQLKH